MEINNKDILPTAAKSTAICVNCEEKEVAEKGMMLCDDCIIHLDGRI